ncbi:indole-diterpene biosynthesis protein-like protein PaxU [Xylaria bambusicola]|uniref:indole-diterpene biosynthesis protein-like protein PaxU n=1 Tax=Xylaria bambusicola TaxID=326684 RepID=UPI0020077E7D|nr:indole-diterpene biosynthesis protein-like protein PaxU [Xylaria bambusicola]KAI0502808.1 indole-diterpene biosynthesis protein-like protein PaxU [Xylaria bambusicola]
MVQTRGYARLGPDISLYTPEQPKIGQLVIICPSIGIAKTRYVCDYESLYRNSAPRAKILILSPTKSGMLSSYQKQEDAMKPAADAICDILNECDRLQSAVGGSKNSHTRPRILLHAIGNGGFNSATNLLVALERRTKRNLPLVGLICDSAPGGASYTKACRALTYSFITDLTTDFPTGILRWVLVHAVLSIVYLFIAFTRYEAPGAYWRKSILDKKLIDCNKVYYFASIDDKVTDWRDVLSHAKQARQQGWEVKELLYDYTPHCGHIRREKQRINYEDAIYYLWEGKKI